MSWETLAWARRARTGSPGRKAVLMVLAEYADEADSCYPSQATIADATEQSVRTVGSQLADLERAGLIRREHRGNQAGGRTSDRYFLLVAAPDPPANLAGNPDPLSANRWGVTGKSEGGYMQPVADEPPVLEPPVLEQVRATAPVLAAGFEEFWTAYPNRAAKGAARKAWPAAVRSAGSMRAVIVGAESYRDDPNRDPRFTKHASTWLRSECWQDPPLPPRGGTPAKPIDTDRSAPSGLLAL